jgi:hypothetical protein
MGVALHVSSFLSDPTFYPVGGEPCRPTRDGRTPDAFAGVRVSEG